MGGVTGADNNREVLEAMMAEKGIDHSGLIKSQQRETITKMRPFAMGACLSVGGNIIADAFGVVAMVAMTPLITIQILGLVFQLRARKAESEEAKLAAVPAEEAVWGDYDIIDL